MMCINYYHYYIIIIPVRYFIIMAKSGQVLHGTHCPRTCPDDYFQPMQKNIDMRNRLKLPPTKSSLALQQRSALSGQKLYEIVADGEEHTACAALRRRSSALSVLLGKSHVHRNSLLKDSEPEDLPKSETVSKGIDRVDLNPSKNEPDKSSETVNPRMKRRTGFFSLERRSSFMDLGRQQVKTGNDDRGYTASSLS